MEALRKAAEARIAKQTEGCTADAVDKIVLHGQALPIPGPFPNFTNLTQLTLVSMKPPIKSLNDLMGLQPWKALVLLDVSDNAITVPCALPGRYPSLRRLHLPNNKIATMEEVKCLASAFPNVEVVDLIFNPVFEESRFSEYFTVIPSMIVLNSRQQDGEEVIVEDIDESEESEEDDTDEEEDDNEEEEEDESETSSEEDHEAEPAAKRGRTE
eukprot:gene9730-6818_t